MPAEMNAPHYPAVAFRFGVWVGGVSGTAANGAKADASFQEIFGIKAEFDHDDVVEGGENRFVHRLPKPARQQNLVLKRGMVLETSRLAQWVDQTLSSNFATPIEPRQVIVKLLNEELNPLVTWTFDKAYPVRWEISALNSMENAILIETVELCYTYFVRE